MTPVGQRERFSTGTPGFRPRIPEATRCYFRSRIVARREFLQTLATRNFRSRIPAGPTETIKAPQFMAANSCGSSQDAISGREFLSDPKLFLHPVYEREFLQTPVMGNFRPRIPA
jgi:hypothetical protein